LPHYHQYLNVLRNFNDITKLFAGLYLATFLSIAAKPFFSFGDKYIPVNVEHLVIR